MYTNSGFTLTHNIQNDTYQLSDSTCCTQEHFSLQDAKSEYAAIRDKTQDNKIEVNAINYI